MIVRRDLLREVRDVRPLERALLAAELAIVREDAPALLAAVQIVARLLPQARPLAHVDDPRPSPWERALRCALALAFAGRVAPRWPCFTHAGAPRASPRARFVRRDLARRVASTPISVDDTTGLRSSGPSTGSSSASPPSYRPASWRTCSRRRSPSRRASASARQRTPCEAWAISTMLARPARRAEEAIAAACAARARQDRGVGGGHVPAACGVRLRRLAVAQGGGAAARMLCERWSGRRASGTRPR